MLKETKSATAPSAATTSFQSVQPLSIAVFIEWSEAQCFFSEV